MKRFGVRRLARYYGGGLAFVALAALTLFVVLPALASNANDQVPPASGAGVMPVDVGVGGNQSCSSQGLFPNMTGVQQTTDPSPPQSGTALVASGNGWNFKLTAGALPGFQANKGQSLAVDSQGNAAIVGIAIKGGTDNLAYDYRPTAQGWVSSDTKLHAPASKFTDGTNPETGITQYYGVSQLVICWKPGPLTTIKGNAYKTISGNPGIPGLSVTLKDTSTPGTQTTTTDASGNYSFPAIPGDKYTVCISNPSTSGTTHFANTQSVPASDTGSCQGTTGTNGYSIASLPAGGSTDNFGFQPIASVTANAFLDNNGDGVNNSGDASASTGVQLFDASNNPIGSQQTTTGGSYTFNSLAVGQTYKVCLVTPSGGSYNETVPTSSTANEASCPVGYASIGYSFTLTSAGQTVSFGFQPLKTITVNTFIDNNGDGVFKSGDTAASTNVALFDSSNQLIGTQEPTSGGQYVFTVPINKTYTVCAVTPSGSYNETAPTSGASCPAGYASFGYSYTNLSANQTANFGFVPLKSITVNTFIDNNGDGVNNGGDIAASTNVALFNSSNQLIGTQEPTSSGQYVFTNVPIGQTYTVCAVTPSGGSFNETAPTSGASCPAGYASLGYSFAPLTTDQTVSFGFEPIGSLGGTVYQDNNGPAGVGADGKFEAGTDSPLSLWGVTLYDGSGTVVGTTTSDVNGQYSFSLPFDPTQTYRVCVTPPGSMGIYGQSEPLPTSPDNCLSPELQKGQTFQPSSSGSTVAENFGVDPAVPEAGCPPGPPTTFGFDNTSSGGSALQIKLAGCKARPQSFVFDSGSPGDPNYPWVSVWASDQTQPEVPLIERIVFPDPITGGKPTLQHLAYTDVFPYDPAASEQMAFCRLDPRDPSDLSGMTLANGFLNDSTKSQVLPATNAGTPTPATSCAISIRTYVDASGNSWLEAYVYTDIDGFTKGIG